MLSDIEIYWNRCFRYARRRQASIQEAENFAQNCWIWTFSSKWNTSMDKLWANHFRSILGRKDTPGSREFSLKMKFAKTTCIHPSGEEEDIFSMIDLTSKESDKEFPKLLPRSNMLFVLLQAGWTPREIQSAFNLPFNTLTKWIESLRFEIKGTDITERISDHLLDVDL